MARENVAIVEVTDDQIRHMEDWLIRYAPATKEEIAKLPLDELIQGFIAYHKVDNE